MNRPPDSPLLLIVNRAAGRGAALKALRRVTIVLDRSRRPFRVEFSESAEHAGELSLLGTEAGEVPVAVGGDGQVTNVARPLIGSDQPIGVIPCGRGNDFARGLGIPAEPESALAILLEGKGRRVDVGQANGHRYLGIASVGFDSKANEIANRSGFLPGGLIYAWSAIRALVGWRAVRFTVKVEGKSSRIQAHTIAVANNRYYGAGMKMAPEARLDDGLLDLVIVRDVSRVRFLANFPKVFGGRHVDGVDVTSTPVPEVELDAGIPLTVYADGDPLTDLPAVFRITPRALSVFCPPHGEG